MIKDRIIHSIGRKLVDIRILITEAMVIRGTLRVVGDYKMNNSIMKSDSYLVINFILCRIKFPNQIINHAKDILSLISNFNNIQFNYYNRSRNPFTDGFAKNSLYLGKIFVYINGFYY